MTRRFLILALVAGIVAMPLGMQSASAVPFSQQCRYRHGGWWSVGEVKHTIRCASRAFDPPGGVRKALQVSHCESRWHAEKPGSAGPHSHHGTFQYAVSTFRGQLNHMPAVVRGYDLIRRVHNARSNILAAIAWASRNGWGPWSCA